MLRALPLLLTASLGLAGCTIIPAAGPGAYAPTRPSPPRASATPRPAQTQPAPQVTYAALGQTVSVKGSQLTPLKILEDSRCPANARCVWVGQVRLRVRVKTGAQYHDLEMTSGKPVRVAGGTLELVEVRPDKFTQVNSSTVEPRAYRFGFRFTGRS